MHNNIGERRKLDLQFWFLIEKTSLASKFYYCWWEKKIERGLEAREGRQRTEIMELTDIWDHRGVWLVYWQQYWTIDQFSLDPSVPTDASWCVARGSPYSASASFAAVDGRRFPRLTAHTLTKDHRRDDGRRLRLTAAVHVLARHWDVHDQAGFFLFATHDPEVPFLGYTS